MIKEFAIQNYLSSVETGSMYDEIMTGLTSNPKYILPKFFYDKAGSELFEEITQLYEYYPTRVEKQILSEILNMIDIDLDCLTIIELGSGDPSKIKLLLNQIPRQLLRTINYFPVDICDAEIEKCVEILSEEYPLKHICGIIADFHHQLHVLPKEGNRLFCFFGSTIGNFTMEEAKEFLLRLQREMKPGDSLLLGVDMVKYIPVIERAYNDSEGVTARFNLNILEVVNHIIGSDFCIDDFEHLAFFNKEQHRVEMHLRALKDMIVILDHSSRFITLRKNETIHTEYSHKFTSDKIEQLCEWGGFSAYKICNDPQGWFSIIYAVR